MGSSEGLTDWTTRPIREVCRIVSGGTPPKSDGHAWRGSFPWASGKDLKTPRLRDTIDHITEDAARAHSKIAPAGSVLVLVRGMGLANGLAVSLVERPMAFNQDLKALIPGEYIGGPFLMYGLMWAGEQVLQNVTTAAHGTKRLTQDDIADFPLAIPTMTEQGAIAAVLDEARTALDAVRRAEHTAQELKAVALRELFSRGLHHEEQKETELGLIPSSWEVARLGELAKIGNGTTPNRTDTRYWVGGTIPWITSGRMYERRIRGSDVHVTPTALAEVSLPLLPPGTVLIAIVGEGKTLGHCAILEVEATTSRHVGFIQLRGGRLLPEFLIGNLESRYQYLRQLASGNGSTRAALTGAILKGVQVPVPPIDQQHEIVAILDAIDGKADHLRRKRAVLDELFKSLLHKLMTGEVRVADLDLSALDAPPEARP